MKDESVRPKLQLTYPCEWPYVVIGISESDLRNAVGEIVQEQTHTVSLSRSSARGNYVSLKVLVVVQSDAERTRIYEALNKHPATKLVI